MKDLARFLALSLLVVLGGVACDLSEASNEIDRLSEEETLARRQTPAPDRSLLSISIGTGLAEYPRCDNDWGFQLDATPTCYMLDNNYEDSLHADTLHITASERPAFMRDSNALVESDRSVGVGITSIYVVVRDGHYDAVLESMLKKFGRPDAQREHDLNGWLYWRFSDVEAVLGSRNFASVSIRAIPPSPSDGENARQL